MNTNTLPAIQPSWKMEGDPIRGYHIRDASGGLITEEHSVPECQARLIAAAPDLLAALEAATEALEGFGCEDVPHYRAAIAKARGE